MGRHSQPETGNGVDNGRVKPAKLKCRVLTAEGSTDWAQTSEIFGVSGKAAKKAAAPRARRQARRTNPWD